MTKYRLSTKPGGELPPNVGLTIKVTKKAATVVAAPTLDCPPLLGITPVEKPVHGFNVSNFVVYIGAPLADDLDVIVTSPDVDVVAFQDADTSEVNFSSAIASVTIIAGDTSALLPYYPGDTATAFTVTAQAAGYDDATTTFDIICETEIIDIVYGITIEAYDLIFVTTIERIFHTGIDLGNKPTGYLNNLVDDNKFEWSNTQTIPISSMRVVARVVTGNLCPADVFTWTITAGTLDTTYGDLTDFNPYSLGDTSRNPNFFQNTVFGYQQYFKPFAFGSPAPDWPIGDTLIINCYKNGILIDHPRATLTIKRVS